jgi:hypothetical protein
LSSSSPVAIVVVVAIIVNFVARSAVAIVLVVVVVRRHPLPSSLSSYPIVPSPVAPSPSTFASRCPIHHLRRTRQWLVVSFSARPAAYQLNYQADNVFIFPHLDLL